MARLGRRRFLAVAGSTAALSAVPGSAAARTAGRSIAGTTDQLLALDPPQFPENLAVNAEGDLLVGITTGEIRRVPREMTDEVGLTIDDTEGVAAVPGQLGGLTVDGDTLYGAVRPENNEGTGAYGITPDGTPFLLGAIAGFPNDLLVDNEHDRLLVTESNAGAVYEVPLDGSGASLWADDPLLAGESLGANGITHFANGVLVANTDAGRLVHLPVDDNGAAGTATTYAESDRLVGADGISTLGPVVYVAANRRNEIVRVFPGGYYLGAANAENGLQFPSDVVFGTVPGQWTDSFVCNFAIQTDGEANPGVFTSGL